MTRELLLDRLQKVRVRKEEVIAQVNALIGRETELEELLVLLPPPVEALVAPAPKRRRRAARG